jgi:tetratricopeptide (TPR) repeat protein
MNAHIAESERETPTFCAGDVVASRWRVERFLARGGMGEVYQAVDLELGVSVALKTLLASRAQSERAAERFRREVRLARRVTHANVARVFDVARHERGADTLVIYTMELLRGESLADRLRREGAMAQAEVASIARGAALGLAAAHEARVLHRDFKSSNVMLAVGPPVRAVVTDFGLARALDEDVISDASLSRDAPLLGTPAYMAPEQVEGREMGVASDVYALGVVLFEMLTGELPFSGPSALAIAVARLTSPPPAPRSRAPWLDARWDGLVLRCLARQPEQRISSMRELARELEELAHCDELLPRAGPPARALTPAPTVTLAQTDTAPAPALARALSSGRQTRTLLPRSRVTRVASVLLLSSALVAGLGYALAARAPAIPMAHGGGRPSIAVMALAGEGSGETEAQTRALLAMLADELSAGHALRVVSTDALVDAPRDAKRLRELLGVDYVFDVAPVSSGASEAEARLLDARTGSPLQTLSVGLDGTSARAAVEELAARARSELGLREPPAHELAAARAALPGDGEAIRLYLEGKDLLVHFEAAAAARLLEQAVALDPSFALAHAAHSRALAELGRTKEAVAAAERAQAASAALPRELALGVEALAHEARLDWARAAGVYRSLHGFYPDDRQHTLDLARALTVATTPQEAWDVLAELVAKDPTAEADPRVLLARAEAANSKGDHKSQLPLAERARVRAHDMGARALEARATLAVANARVKLEGARASIPDYERAERLYDELNIKGGAGKVAVLAAWAYALSDDSKKALAAAQRALDIARRGGDRRLEAIAIVQTGFAQLKTDPQTARARYEEGLEILRELDSTGNITWALGNLAGLDLRQGKLASARARHQERASLARAARLREDEMTSLMAVASIAVKAGELDAAMRAVDAALPTLVDLGLPNRQGTLLVTRADVHIERAELELASETLDQALERFRMAQNADGERVVLGRRAQVARALLDYDRARTSLREDIDKSRAAGDPAGAAWAVLALAELEADARGRIVIGEIDEARRLLEAQDIRDGLAWGESVLARALMATGDGKAALETARRALEHASPLESRVLRLRTIANAARVLRALGRLDEASKVSQPALAEALRLGLKLRAAELRK